MKQLEKDKVRQRNEENKDLKQYELIQNRENKNEDDVDLNLFFKTATAENETSVDGLNLHEIENNKSRDYEGESEMIGDLIIVEHIRKTYMKYQRLRSLY